MLVALNEMKSVCVFCGAQDAAPKVHQEMAYTLGEDLARAGKQLVYGGGDCGLMGAVANGALAQGGKVIGVFPRSLGRIEVEHHGLTQMHMVDSMHERKQIMYDNSDVFVILPGGFGTLDEMFEVITWHQIGIHTKKVVIYNHLGYWDHLVALMDNIINTKFAKEINRTFYTVVDSKADLYRILGL